MESIFDALDLLISRLYPAATGGKNREQLKSILHDQFYYGDEGDIESRYLLDDGQGI